MLTHDHQRFNECVTAARPCPALCEVEHPRPTDEHPGHLVQTARCFSNNPTVFSVRTGTMLDLAP